MRLDFMVNIGEVVTLRGRSTNIVCRGLGSCIGLFLYDRKAQVVGVAHVLLPGKWQNSSLSQTCFSINAVEELVYRMKVLGGMTEMMEAKLVGGANVANINSIETGRSNVESVAQALEAHAIGIRAMEIGGTLCRTATFTTDTCEVTVVSKQNKSYQVKI
jgi:chemotaxis protein CheD